MSRKLFFTLTLVSLFTLPAFAQDGGVDLSFPPQTAEVGGTVDVPVLLETGGPTSMVSVFVLDVPLAQLELSGWTPGESIQAFIDDHGEPFCDFQLAADSFAVFILFPTEYSSDEYGPNLGTLHFNVSAKGPGTAEFGGFADSVHGSDEAVGVVNILQPGQFLRGDADDDGLIVPLTDGLFLLQFGFLGGAPLLARTPLMLMMKGASMYSWIQSVCSRSAF